MQDHTTVWFALPTELTPASLALTPSYRSVPEDSTSWLMRYWIRGQHAGEYSGILTLVSDAGYDLWPTFIACSRVSPRRAVAPPRARGRLVAETGHPPIGRKSRLSSVSRLRPVFMSTRDFDFETAIWDCRSAAIVQARRPLGSCAIKGTISDTRVRRGELNDPDVFPSRLWRVDVRPSIEYRRKSAFRVRQSPRQLFRSICLISVLAGRAAR